MKGCIGIERNTKKKFCVLQKKVIWAKPHSRSSAKQFGRTKHSVGHYSDPSWLAWAEIKSVVHVALPKQLIKFNKADNRC